MTRFEGSQAALFWRNTPSDSARAQQMAILTHASQKHFTWNKTPLSQTRRSLKVQFPWADVLRHSETRRWNIPPTSFTSLGMYSHD